MLVKREGRVVEIQFRSDLSNDYRKVFEAVSPGDGGRYQAVFVLRDGRWIISGDSHHMDLGVSRRIPDDLFRHFLIARKKLAAARAEGAARSNQRAMKRAMERETGSEKPDKLSEVT